MSLRELQNYTFTAKYARYNEDKKRRETWGESVDRMKQMMVRKYDGYEVGNLIDQAYDAVTRKEILGSQRALQFGGLPIEKRPSRLYNCISSYADRPRFFQECMYLLLCGCGTGFSVQKHHVNRMPELIEKKHGTKKFVVEDSIVGWSDAIGVLVTSYMQQDELFPAYNGKKVTFDFSKISKKGTALTSCNGKAPGPEPLKKALERIEKLLNRCLEMGLTKLRPIDAYDIVMHSADAVISGGVRRSACSAIFSKDDEEMMASKTGNWFEENPQRGRANNSVMLIRDETSYEEFEEFLKTHTIQFGEPGFVWSDSLELLLNPCFEIGFWAYDIVDEKKYAAHVKANGYTAPITQDLESVGLVSGWQACNLTTINCQKIKNIDDFYTSVENATIIGTLQAGFTDFKYLTQASINIIRREALLGVSMTGIMENADICLDPKTQKQAASLAKKVNKKVAKLIGINQAARVCAIKPEGTASAVLGTSSGIHPHHAKRYIRRVQANKTEEVYKFFKEYNPLACEESVWSTNNTDDAVSFCVEVPAGSKLKNQIPALELLKFVKETQQNWVESGKNADLCTQPWLSHNVSNTVTVKADEWEEVIKYMYKHRKYFCGVALLSATGDKDYPQAPFTTIYLPSEIVAYYGDSALLASGLIEISLSLYEDDLWAACDVLLGRGKRIRGDAKRNWKAQCEKFAKKYLNNDMKRLTYLMKDVYNWKLWVDLNANFKPVDYKLLIEEEDNTAPEQTVACAGGACEII